MIKHIAFKEGQVRQISPKEREEYNAQGWGIFRTVNHFKDVKSLKKDNVEKIIYWFVDIDEGTKEKNFNELMRLPLRPTIIIETKAGYHAYWRALNATQENFKCIEKGIAKKLCRQGVEADPAVCNMNRFLRAPGYFHLKNPIDPFKITTRWRDIDLRYTEEEMMKHFPFTQTVITSRGESDIVGLLEKRNIQLHYDRCYCPIKQKKEGRKHSSETKGVPAMQIFADTNSFYCFACGRAGTSDQLEELL